MKLINNLYFYPERGMLDANTYVIDSNPGIIIDPGNPMFLPALVDSLDKDGIDPQNIGIILNTHLHGDHCGANEAFKNLSGAEIYIHLIQKKYYDVVVVQGARVFGLSPIEFEEDAIIGEDVIRAGDMELEMVHAPGHSPDCICYYRREDRVLICGDVVFNGNTGRVDLPGGSAAELKKSIDELSNLEIDYLLPGHMDIVIGTEKVKRNFDFIKDNIVRWL